MSYTIALLYALLPFLSFDKDGRCVFLTLTTVGVTTPGRQLQISHPKTLICSTPLKLKNKRTQNVTSNSILKIELCSLHDCIQHT